MAAVEVVARNLHRGHIGISGNGDVRPECDSCGWKGPRYARADEPVAQVGLDAHIATANPGGHWRYQISTNTRTAVWDWEALEWQ